MVSSTVYEDSARTVVVGVCEYTTLTVVRLSLSLQVSPGLLDVRNVRGSTTVVSSL